MKESYVKGLANHSDPESCGGARKSDGEALTGESAGRVLSRESSRTRDADSVEAGGRQQPACRLGEARWYPARSETPGMQRKQLAREPGVLDGDISSFFDKLDHEWLIKFIEHRLADRRVVRLIRKWLNAGVLEEGRWWCSDEGTPVSNARPDLWRG